VAVTASPGRRALFLDKDGTLIENVPYNVDPGAVRLTTGAGEALRAFAKAGFALILVSNQSGVARGLFPPAALNAVERRLEQLLAPFEVGIQGFYYCPHHPQATVAAYRRDCDCRKPRPGLLTRAAREHGLDLARSWTAGDILDDVEAGCRAGCRSVLIDGLRGGGGETEWLPGPCRSPDLIVRDLMEAAELILVGDDHGREDECEAIPSS
jgi:D-glycero-D-manno-heptose 1,7-bisphosphate phosphatase